MPAVQEILSAIDALAPFATQCDWDNSGLLVGDRNKEVHRVAFALDLTQKTLQAAFEKKVDLLVTHHPVIFRAKRSLLSGDPVVELLRRDIAVISCHTPWDCASLGVNDILCGLLQLKDVHTVETPDSPAPFLRIGTPDSAMTPQRFAEKAARVLQTTVRLASCGKPIQTVAVCGGAAMEFCEPARLAGADVFLTGDAKHHELLDAVESGISVVAGGHFETEHPSIIGLKNLVQETFPALDCFVLEEENPVEFFTCR